MNNRKSTKRNQQFRVLIFLGGNLLALYTNSRRSRIQSYPFHTVVSNAKSVCDYSMRTLIPF
ncbi:MAG: hypothetical protein COT43_06890 [Candidatus Marinimicrobia bacterium CG08_land_8_20_14_0_20_45_22]|nr:MAG: hypothetical protein COT43_06890 [Candidatus Marinimicrobia bacterium CG08_land_8_20_14_0_20_45_22]